MSNTFFQGGENFAGVFTHQRFSWLRVCPFSSKGAILVVKLCNHEYGNSNVLRIQHTVKKTISKLGGEKNFFFRSGCTNFHALFASSFLHPCFFSYLYLICFSGTFLQQHGHMHCQRIPKMQKNIIKGN